MKRALALAAVLVLALSGCARHARLTGGDAAGGAAPTAVATQAAAPAPATGGDPAPDPAAVDAQLSTLDQYLSTVDTELTQASQAADADGDTAGAQGVALTVTTATPAPRSLPAEKAVALSRIDGRLHTLAALQTAVTAATNLTGGHRATLSGLVRADAAGLTALRAKMAAEQSVSAVRADEHSMVVDYRIYLLVVPKVRLTIASDVETAALAKLNGVSATLSKAIAAAAAKGKDVSAEKAELADLGSQAAAAQAVIAGKADALLTVAPGPDAAQLTAAVSPVRAAVRTGRQDLRKAVADARQIRKQL